MNGQEPGHDTPCFETTPSVMVRHFVRMGTDHALWRNEGDDLDGEEREGALEMGRFAEPMGDRPCGSGMWSG